MMIVVCVGYAAVKLQIVDENGSSVLSGLIVYIVQPCMIVRSFEIEITPERLYGFLWVLFFGFLIYVIWIVALEILKKPLRLDAIDRTTLIYSNVGNLTLPIVNMVLGTEYVFYACALQIPFSAFMWTHGFCTISGQRKVRFTKIILNPNVVALLFGLILFVFQLRLPGILDTSVNSLADMVGPASMLVIGMSISQSNLKKVFTNRRAYVIAAGRLIVMPMTVLLVLFVSGVPMRRPELIPVLQVLVIALSAPPASSVSQLAVLFEQRSFDAAVYNVLATIACILTMPMTLALYEAVFSAWA